ncbi:hypothetical protein BGZ65_001058, partial [Modicella reniformis]
VRADIITRGTRSLGFGFVVYETLAHAENAADTFNKTELGGRTINVEVAKPKVERPPREPREPRERGPRQPRDENKDDFSAEADADTDAADFRPRTGRSNRGPRRNRKPREPREPREFR